MPIGIRLSIILVCALALAGGVRADEPATLAAHWPLDEGQGTAVGDRSGNGNAGAIHGARWADSPAGNVLRFDGVDDYVDCGSDPSLDIRGPVTLELWACPSALPAAEPGIAGKFIESFAITLYKTGAAYFYISSGGNNAYGELRAGQWSHLAGVFDGQMVRMYINGIEVGSAASKFPSVNAGGRFVIGGIFGDANNSDIALQNTAYFAGMVSDVRVYRGALSRREVVEHYNEKAEKLGQPAIDVGRFGTLGLRAYPYADRGEIVVKADYQWVKPVLAGSVIRAELFAEKGDAPVSQSSAAAAEGRSQVDVTLAVPADMVGPVRLRAAMVMAEGVSGKREEISIAWPPPLAAPPAPSERVVPPLPAPVLPSPYVLRAGDTGGFVVEVGGVSFPVHSRFSYPYGGANGLTAATMDTGAEKTWTVTHSTDDSGDVTVRGKGEYYRIDRIIRRRATRIEVEDTFTNTTESVIGIVVEHQIDATALPGARVVVRGNPSVFVSSGEKGLGLLALDDVLDVQQRTYAGDDGGHMVDDHFGLDAGKSYTMMWAVYPTATSEYFDFVNQARHDEGLGGLVEGTVELTSRWGSPLAEAVFNKGVKYPSVCYLTHSLSNPHNSLEGWEFTEYPELCDRIRAVVSETKEKYPDIQPLFHVAPNLYITNEPRTKFSDSLAMTAAGSADHYGSDSIDYYGNYIARELFDAGWRWWLFYATPENSFGKHSLAAADYMINSLGAKSVWADGFFGEYIKGFYTYDCWDGHSVTIDRQTKLVTRKKSHVTLAQLPVLRELTRKYAAAGGVLIANGVAGPRSMWRERMINSCETGGGDQQPVGSLYFGQTVTPLGNTVAVKDAQSLYDDVLSKLNIGALYFYYGEQDFVKERSIVAYMYPITFGSIHEGTVRGKERIVTCRDGVYGWAGDAHLHAVECFDGRGRHVRNTHVTTVDGEGVRTGLTLEENASAVIVKTSISMTASAPVNLIMDRADEDGASLRLNGEARIELNVEKGWQVSTDVATCKLRRGEKEGVWLADIEGEVTLEIKR